MSSAVHRVPEKQKELPIDLKALLITLSVQIFCKKMDIIPRYGS